MSRLIVYFLVCVYPINKLIEIPSLHLKVFIRYDNKQGLFHVILVKLVSDTRRFPRKRNI